MNRLRIYNMRCSIYETWTKKKYGTADRKGYGMLIFLLFS